MSGSDVHYGTVVCSLTARICFPKARHMCGQDTSNYNTCGQDTSDGPITKCAVRIPPSNERSSDAFVASNWLIQPLIQADHIATMP
eukprot:9477717-Pyramimonas_sp.AAC.2